MSDLRKLFMSKGKQDAKPVAQKCGQKKVFVHNLKYDSLFEEQDDKKPVRNTEFSVVLRKNSYS